MVGSRIDGDGGGGAPPGYAGRRHRVGDHRMDFVGVVLRFWLSVGDESTEEAIRGERWEIQNV